MPQEPTLTLACRTEQDLIALQTLEARETVNWKQYIEEQA